MNNLSEKWAVPPSSRRVYRIPTTVRLLPHIDCQIQDILAEYPHLKMAHVINDLLETALEQLNRMV